MKCGKEKKSRGEFGVVVLLLILFGGNQVVETLGFSVAKMANPSVLQSQSM